MRWFVGSLLIGLSGCAAGLDCVRWSGTPSDRGACLDRPPGLVIGALITGVLTIGVAIPSLVVPSRPTTQAEDEALVKDFDARSRGSAL